MNPQVHGHLRQLAVGSTQEIANVEGFFAQHGVLTTVAKTMLGVVRDPDCQSHAQHREGSD